MRVMCHLEALGAEGVLTGQDLVQVTQLLQADGALKEVRQVHPGVTWSLLLVRMP